MRAEVHRDVVVHEVSGVAIQRCCVQVHVLNLSQAVVGQATFIAERLNYGDDDR